MMAKKKRILILNGPNLNLLGKRQPEIYGRLTLEEIGREIRSLAKQLSVTVDIRQSNNEGELVDWIQQAPAQFGAIVINPAAIIAAGIPAIEIHISNIYKREAFRKHSYIAGVAVGQITGFGVQSYLLGLRAAVECL
jgi:3-dehydroquinate dehydratase-2